MNISPWWLTIFRCSKSNVQIQVSKALSIIHSLIHSFSTYILATFMCRDKGRWQWHQGKYSMSSWSVHSYQWLAMCWARLPPLLPVNTTYPLILHAKVRPRAQGCGNVTADNCAVLITCTISWPGRAQSGELWDARSPSFQDLHSKNFGTVTESKLRVSEGWTKCLCKLFLRKLKPDATPWFKAAQGM